MNCVDLDDEEFDGEFDYRPELMPPPFYDRHFLKDLLRHTGRSHHVQLTVPLDILADVDHLMRSRSLFFVMAIEKHFRNNEMLDTNIPALNQLFNVIFEQRRALAGVGSDDVGYGLKIRARRAFCKRWRRAFDTRIAELDALSVKADARISRQTGPAVNFSLFFGRHHMNSLFRHVGKVGRCQVIVPTYLLRYVDCVSDSRSLFVSMLVDDLLRKMNRRTGKAASIRKLHGLMVGLRVASGGRDPHDVGYYHIFRIRHVYLKRWLRVTGIKIAKLCGTYTEKMKLLPRVKIRRPYVRIWQRRTDSESEMELGKESDSYMEYLRDNPDAKQELLHEDPERFKELFPDDYDEWYRESDSAYEEEVEEPLGK